MIYHLKAPVKRFRGGSFSDFAHYARVSTGGVSDRPRGIGFRVVVESQAIRSHSGPTSPIRLDIAYQCDTL
jgi:hypothetical protein